MSAFSANGVAFGTTLTNTSVGTSDVFVVKYNTSGTVQWVARICGSGTSASNEFGYGIASDSSANVYVTGRTDSTVVTAFSSNGSAFGTTIPAGTFGFIIKYDTNGSVQWVAYIGGSGANIGWAIATDSGGNVYATGVAGFGSTNPVNAINADGTTGGTFIPSSNDAFVVKYNTSGTVQWIARLSSTISDIGYGITTDSSGDVYVCGNGGTGGSDGIMRAYNADGTLFGSVTLPTYSGIGYSFVAKYSTSGTVQWVSIVNGTLDNLSRAIKLDSSNNIYTTGSFTGSSLIPYSV